MVRNICGEERLGGIARCTLDPGHAGGHEPLGHAGDHAGQGLRWYRGGTRPEDAWEEDMQAKPEKPPSGIAEAWASEDWRVVRSGLEKPGSGTLESTIFLGGGGRCPLVAFDAQSRAKHAALAMASRDAVCSYCGLTYGMHPRTPLTASDEVALCNGQRVQVQRQWLEDDACDEDLRAIERAKGGR